MSNKSITGYQRIIFSTNFICTSLLIGIAILYFSYLDSTIKFFGYDEIFTSEIVKYSYREIWKITATDVHPPLYYMMLKGFLSIFGDAPIVYRLFSTLGIVTILITGLFFVRRYFGQEVSTIFVILVIILPVAQYLVTEIRMYSWSMFFVLATLLSAYRIKVNGAFINYLSLLFFSVCSAYSHYFALLGILSVFFFLFLFMLSDRKKIKRVLIILVLFITIYALWIPEFTHQILRVNNDYWIDKPTLKDILLFSYYSFSPKEPSHPYLIFNLKEMSVALSFMLILIASVILYSIINLKKLDIRYTKTAFLFLLIGLSPIVLALIYSCLSKPIIVSRYINCYLGVLILGFSIIIWQVYKYGKKIRIIIYIGLCMLLALSVVRFFSERKYNDIKYEELTELKSFLKEKSSGKVTFLTTINSTTELALLEYAAPDNLYLFYSSKKTLYTVKPYSFHEVNQIPHDFDFFLIRSTVIYDKYKPEINLFMKEINENYIKEDSLTLQNFRIYLMRTIH